VLGVLVAEASADPEFAQALRERVLSPRRRELTERLERDGGRLRVPTDVALDQLFGALYYRAVIIGAPVSDEFLRTVLAGVLDPARSVHQ